MQIQSTAQPGAVMVCIAEPSLIDATETLRRWWAAVDPYALLDPIPLSHDGGPIPAEDWARACAALIVDIQPTASIDRQAEGRAFEAALIALLTDAVACVQDIERDALDRDGGMRLDQPLAMDAAAVVIAESIAVLAAGRSFAGHFARVEIQDYLRRHIGRRLRTVVHIERLWWCDRHPQSNAGRTYKARHQGA